MTQSLIIILFLLSLWLHVKNSEANDFRDVINQLFLLIKSQTRQVHSLQYLLCV
ncbi:hypothetical protein GS118_004167 [Salmonella enterica]|nr:hypothetical protein [Salmonella enterica]EDW4356421.1 hypothetical protein [Salmonella enterica subsp. salamae]EDS7879618.1 hypothetical protein [Salmonella enterica]EDX9486301.1 hypothetical protein [Salmonella enterica]EEG0758303.1 hypothetical protein [Salmonella enterica]